MIRILLLVVAAAGSRPIPHSKSVPTIPRTFSPITDAAILGALAAADANELESAKLGSSKAAALEVKDFADALVRDHTRTQQQAVLLAKQLGITPAVDTSGAAAHRDVITKLNALSGTAFDHAFVAAMVADHKALIGRVTSSYLPGAASPRLKAFVQRLLPTLRNHLAMGEKWLSQHP